MRDGNTARCKKGRQTRRFYEYFIQQRLKDKCMILVAHKNAVCSHGQVGDSGLITVLC